MERDNILVTKLQTLNCSNCRHPAKYYVKADEPLYFCEFHYRKFTNNSDLNVIVKDETNIDGDEIKLNQSELFKSSSILSIGGKFNWESNKDNGAYLTKASLRGLKKEDRVTIKEKQKNNRSVSQFIAVMIQEESEAPIIIKTNGVDKHYYYSPENGGLITTIAGEFLWLCKDTGYEAEYYF